MASPAKAPTQLRTVCTECARRNSGSSSQTLPRWNTRPGIAHMIGTLAACVAKCKS